MAERMMEQRVVSSGRAGSQVRTSALSSWLGSAMEYYDFVVYGTAAALVFNRVFFPASDPAVGTLIAFSTFGAGYVARPVGGLVWGHLGDHIGRKRALTLTLLLMGVGTFAIGCVPSYASIGMAAPVLLVICRLLQGFSAGGEQAGANTLTLEHSPANRRSFFTSFTMSGTQGGSLVATVIFIPVATLPGSELYSWGWRIPFWCSAIVVGIGFWVRRRVEEPAVFATTVAGGAKARFPLVELFRTSSLSVLRVIGCSLFAVMGTTTSVFALSYGTSDLGIDESVLLAVTVVGNIVAVAVIPVFAVLADRYGRKPVFVTGLVLCGVLIFAYLAALESGRYVLIYLSGIALIGVTYSMSNAVWPAFFGEMFDTPVRYSGTAVGTQVGFVLTGFAPTILTALLRPGSGGWVLSASFAAGCMMVAAIAALSAPERYRTPLSELGAPTGSNR